MHMRAVHRVALVATLIAFLGCGGGNNAKAPGTQISTEQAVNQVEADLKRNLEEIDKDPNRTPKQKEDDKAMMREIVKKRMEGMKK